MVPKAGKYVLAISDEEEKVIDSVHFEVRGPAEDNQFQTQIITEVSITNIDGLVKVRRSGLCTTRFGSRFSS